MKPEINSTSFGSITIDGKKYEKDQIIELSGNVRKRKKKLSKKVYGTSHTISEEEAEAIFEEGVEIIIIGTGQYGRAELSDQATFFFESKDCEVILHPTPEAIKTWNDSEGKIIGMFHVTC
mgnify:CR=1 FL=1